MIYVSNYTNNIFFKTIPKNWGRKKKKKEIPYSLGTGDELCPFTFRVPI